MVYEVSDNYTNQQSRTLAEIETSIVKGIQEAKIESQYITELKEIKQVQNETVWDYDQRFKDVMGRLTFHIPDENIKNGL
jgi:hypothetical protein